MFLLSLWLYGAMCGFVSIGFYVKAKFCFDDWVCALH